MWSEETNHGDNGDEGRRYDECEQVVRRIPFDGEEVGNVRVGIRTAVVISGMLGLA